MAGHPDLERELDALSPRPPSASGRSSAAAAGGSEQRVSMLALMQSTASRHGPSLAEMASMRLMLRALASDTGTEDGAWAAEGGDGAAPGRVRLTGEERDEDVFADDVERWALLCSLVHDDPALAQELATLIPGDVARAATGAATVGGSGVRQPSGCGASAREEPPAALKAA